MNDESSDAFDQASQLLVSAAAAIPDSAWHLPGLGSWTVLELLAHANRAHTTIEDYLLHPQPAQAPDAPYFSADAIAQRARDAVTALGSDPAQAVAAASERVIDLVASTAADAALGSPAGTQTLGDYLPSRTAELVLHGLDLARATSQDIVVPATARTATLAFVARRAAARTDADEVLAALTGRGTLPIDYSVF